MECTRLNLKMYVEQPDYCTIRCLLLGFGNIHIFVYFGKVRGWVTSALYYGTIVGNVLIYVCISAILGHPANLAENWHFSRWESPARFLYNTGSNKYVMGRVESKMFILAFMFIFANIVTEMFYLKKIKTCHHHVKPRTVFVKIFRIPTTWRHEGQFLWKYSVFRRHDILAYLAIFLFCEINLIPRKIFR